MTQPILGGLSDSLKFPSSRASVSPCVGARVTFTTGARESDFKLNIQCLLYWSIIASDKSRLRLNFVSFHQHGIRWGLSCIQLLRDYQRLDWYQVSKILGR